MISWPILSLAEAGTKILAVVGDEVITLNDVQKRYNVVVATNNITISSEEENHAFSRQLLHSLINEKIFSQEAKRLKITASDTEINNVISHIEKQRNLSKGGFDSFLKSKNIAKEDAISQISNSIIWEKILETIIARQVRVSNKELNEYIEKQHLGEYKVGLYLFSAPSMQELKKTHSEIKHCPLDRFKPSPNIGVSNLQNTVRALPENIRSRIFGMNIGHKTPIFQSGKEYRFFILCQKKSPLNEEQVNEIRASLIEKKTHLQADYYMKNLSKKTFIEIYP